MNENEELEELIGFIQAEPPNLLGLITPAVAYMVPVPEFTPYDGPFEFVPSAETQVAAVGGHTVSTDIIIHDIPFAEVTNPNGGYTVTIGG